MSNSKYSSMSTDALRCKYVKEFKKAMRVVSMSAVPYNGFYGCYSYAPAVARSLRDVTTRRKNFNAEKEELQRREGGGLKSNRSDSVTVYGDGVCRAIPTARVVIPTASSTENMPLIAEVEMVTMVTATTLPIDRDVSVINCHR